MAEEVKIDGRRAHGSIRGVIIEVMKRMGDSPNGRSAEDLMSHVNAKHPEITLRQVSQALVNMTSRGGMERPAPGRFRLVEGAPPITRKPRAPRENVEQGDMATLEEALAMLGKLEKLIKKYQELAGALAKLR